MGFISSDVCNSACGCFQFGFSRLLCLRAGANGAQPTTSLPFQLPSLSSLSLAPFSPVSSSPAFLPLRATSTRLESPTAAAPAGSPYPVYSRPPSPQPFLSLVRPLSPCLSNCLASSHTHTRPFGLPVHPLGECRHRSAPSLQRSATTAHPLVRKAGPILPRRAQRHVTSPHLATLSATHCCPYPRTHTTLSQHRCRTSSSTPSRPCALAGPPLAGLASAAGSANARTGSFDSPPPPGFDLAIAGPVTLAFVYVHSQVVDLCGLAASALPPAAVLTDTAPAQLRVVYVLSVCCAVRDIMPWR